MTERLQVRTIGPRQQLLLAVLVCGALPSITAIVYLADGTKSVFPQLYYFAILAGAIGFGARGGLLVGLVAGVLCGPLMPLDVSADIAQPFERWTFRMTTFALVGVVVGAYASNARARVAERTAFTHAVIRAFVRVIDAKSRYTAEHSEHVATFAIGIARECGFDADTVERVYLAALLHDIGKLRTPDAILNKPGALTECERQRIEQHPIDSVQMLAGIAQFDPYVPAIRHHHERIDGTGYPDGLAGDAIPLEARILAIADSFEAMTAARPYRPALPRSEALRRLQEGAGTQFDASLVTCFERYARGAGLLDD
jgi:putative nucleotidyltransferase with HDIG domain